MQRKDVYDYIVVGSGSSGAVVARRLSDDPNVRVLLLEAGPDDQTDRVRNPFIPKVFEGRHDPDITRNLIVEPGQAVGKDWPEMPWPSMHVGRIRGGTSAINGAVYARGHRRIYDHWAELVRDRRWSFQNVLPLFKRSEDYEHGEDEYHGAGGPLPVRDMFDESQLAQAFTHAATEIGFDGPRWDFNGARQENGAGLFQLNVRSDYVRASSAIAFLDPVASRENLIEKTGVMACRVGFEGKRAAFVDCLDINADPAFRQGVGVRYRAEREIILCAGALETPKLLMHSGIGPARELREHGIPVNVDLPGVGRHLMDHLLVVMFVDPPMKLESSRWTGEACLFTRTSRCPPSEAPDLQFHVSSAIDSFEVAGITSDPWLCSPTLVQPKSFGSVSLLSADPRQQLRIRPNYLREEADVRVLVEGIKLARELMAANPLKAFVKEELAPGGLATDDRSLARHVRNAARTVWHPAGTCRMGVDRGSVVDSQLRVYGVDGLRVADASIMPSMPNANTHATCVMIGEMVAALARGP